MYGLLLKNLQDYIVDKWGAKKWDAVKEALKLSEVIYYIQNRMKRTLDISFLEKLKNLFEKTRRKGMNGMYYRVYKIVIQGKMFPKESPK